MRPYQWQAAAGQLHAIANTSDAQFPPLPESKYETACGLTVELSQEDFRRSVRRGMCSACNARWIAQQSGASGVAGRRAT